MRLTDIRSCFEPPGPSLGAALLALFFSGPGSAAGDRPGARGRWYDALVRKSGQVPPSGGTPAPRTWPPARRVWQA